MLKDYQWMPATMFEMAATCREAGMTKASNLLTETAILLHICLAQTEGDWADLTDENQCQTKGAGYGRTAPSAEVCLLKPRQASASRDGLLLHQKEQHRYGAAWNE